MGLTKSSVGLGAVDSDFVVRRKSPDDKVVALAGNPNVGKSTLFNGLTGMNQHTGNWPGKTVTLAGGYCVGEKGSYLMVDLPGTYSLMAHSPEEEIAGGFICFAKPDVTLVVCDGTCLERNLNLVLQTLEISNRVVVCVNLMDEAKRKRIKIDLTLLSQRLGVETIGLVARDKKNLPRLLAAVDRAAKREEEPKTPRVVYPETIEKALVPLQKAVEKRAEGKLNSRWLSLRLLPGDNALTAEISACLGEDFLKSDDIIAAREEAENILSKENIDKNTLQDIIVTTLVREAEKVCRGAVIYEKKPYSGMDRRLDKVLTSKTVGYPIMLCLLAFIFWLTIEGANYPSALLSQGLFWVQDRLTDLFTYMNAPGWLHGILVLGVYRVLAWVVSVMLPPMAIFFPLFTLLEDLGYLPRIAYNLDKPFKKCNSCGKQALTMCMGFGCNAAGVVGCRIIDSTRERLLAILTNSFVPCNGRFPGLIAIITMFFVGAAGVGGSVLSALMLTLLILMGIFATFAATKLLSKTLLKGAPSSFTLELPSYRRPQIGKVIVRSIFDRTLFVLGRAVCVAAPAGMIIWLAANIMIGDISLLSHCAAFLDPFARLMGLDGVILMAFILGFPANEIVIPIIIMAYTAEGSIFELGSLVEMKQLFLANGWTNVTALCTMVFSLMHWPCSTTLITIKKETGSLKWTALAAALPTVVGTAICMLIAFVARLFG